MNQLIVEQLTRLIEYKKSLPKTTSLTFSIKSTQAALESIREYRKEITSGAEAKKKVPGVGKGIADRIDEILATGRLKEIPDDFAESNYMELTKLPGIGAERAKRLHEEYGITTIKELRKLYKKGKLTKKGWGLTHQIEVGLKYYDDLQVRIPRFEMKKIDNLLDREFMACFPDDKYEFRYKICGSYRRKKTDSGDIDILITGNTPKVLKKAIHQLKSSGYIVEDYTAEATKKYMGIFKLSKKATAHHLDIRYIDPVSWPFAILYFTGSVEHNVLMRNQAISMGYSLSEYALKDEIGNSVPGLTTERAIFDFLGMEYLRPRKR